MADCIFCKMAEKKINAKIEFENDEVLAIHDINPQAPTHLLVLPKAHVERISDLKRSEDSVLAGKLILAASDIARKHGWDDYRLVFNNGAGAGQSVFHIHLHLLAGRKMTWPPG